jgi:hypothetical protein
MVHRVAACVGRCGAQEHEGIDRPNNSLAGLQSQFAEAVLALNKPTLLVMANGGTLAIEQLVGRCGVSQRDAPVPQRIVPCARLGHVSLRCGAIVEAFNPAQSTPALAALLFGLENRWGKLPVTMYTAAYMDEQPMTNYDMVTPPGRTYRYYLGTPIYSFGYGLSLTTFALVCARESPSSLRFSCEVRNTGARAGDEVVQVYHAAGAAIRRSVDHPVPFRSLVSFERVTVPANASVTVSFELTTDALLVTTAEGERMLYPGERQLVFTNGVNATVSISVWV